MRSKNYKYKIANYKSDIPKPKKNEIVIIPRDNRLMEIPPYLNRNSLPKWWTELPKTSRSLRRCQGTYDYISYGITIPSWTEFNIRPNSNKSNYEHRAIPFSNGDHIFNIDVFPDDSAGGCPLGHSKGIERSDYLKFVNPWSFYTEPGTSLMIIPPLHSPNENYIVMPGMVHTDYYHQLNIVITVLTDKPFTIMPGEPLAHLIPIKRNANFKNIIWGNESMYKFIAGNGLGKGCISQEDNSQVYRKFQKEYDAKENESKWTFFKK